MSRKFILIRSVIPPTLGEEGRRESLEGELLIPIDAIMGFIIDPGDSSPRLRAKFGDKSYMIWPDISIHALYAMLNDTPPPDESAPTNTRGFEV